MNIHIHSYTFIHIHLIRYRLSKDNHVPKGTIYLFKHSKAVLIFLSFWKTQKKSEKQKDLFF